MSTEDPEPLVATPGGPRPASLVQEVDTNIITPGGARPQHLVSMVQPGHRLRATDDRLQTIDEMQNVFIDMPKHLAAEIQASAKRDGGWIASVRWDNNTGSPVNNYIAKWTVPPPPQDQEDQLIYLFNGLTNQYPADNGKTAFGILQPVLQWGTYGALGGKYWSVANWYVISFQDQQGNSSPGPAIHTKILQVQPGQTLTGKLQLTGQSDAGFGYSCWFEEFNDYVLMVDSIAELYECSVALEMYRTGGISCPQYPNVRNTDFTGINLQTEAGLQTVAWGQPEKSKDVTDCKQRADVVDPSATAGTVRIFYQQ